MPSIPADNTNILQPGQQIANYVIISLLGSGGMAEVYLARHVKNRKKCAVKVMRPSVYKGNDVLQKRFLQEISIGINLSHPAIVKVLEGGRDEQTGLLFIAMEYINGITLEQEAKKKLFSAKKLREVLVVMADVLQVFQDNGLVHRDIKPANIMRSKDGKLHLMDMGIVKMSASQNNEITLTTSDAVIGTPEYSSPEQLRSSHNVTIASDIYSLGATLYYLASGKTPFSGESSVAIMIDVCDISKVPVPLETHRPDLPADLLEIISKMLIKPVMMRINTTLELRQLLAIKKKRHFSIPLSGLKVILKPLIFIILCLFLFNYYKRKPNVVYALVNNISQRDTNKLFSYAGQTDRAIGVRRMYVIPGEYLVVDLTTGEIRKTHIHPDPSAFSCKTVELWLRKIDAIEDYKYASIPFSNVKHGKYGSYYIEDSHVKECYVGIFEVTQRQYEQVMGYNPSFFYNWYKPVDSVNYEMVRGGYGKNINPHSFIGRLRARCGGGAIPFDLPSEDEANILCFAAYNLCSFRLNFDYYDPYVPRYDIPLECVAHCQLSSSNFISATAEVGSYLPSIFGLYDTLGNVSEMCIAHLDGSYSAIGGDFKMYSQSKNEFTLANTKYYLQLNLVKYLPRHSFSSTVGFRVFISEPFELPE